MQFRSKETDEIVDLKIIDTEDGGVDVVQTKLDIGKYDAFGLIAEEVVWERHYKNRRDFYEDFEDVYLKS